MAPLAALNVVSPEGAKANPADFTVVRNPSPPNYVVNDGTMSEAFHWTIEFLSIPHHYTFEIQTYPGHVPVAGTFVSYDISGQSSPIYNPEWPLDHVWDVPLGQPAGQYIGRIEYYNFDGGTINFEDAWEGVFYVNNKAHLVVDASAPAVVSTLQHFTVSATITNTGQSQADGVTATIGITGPASTADPLTKSTSPANIPGSSGTGTVSWDLQCTGPGQVTIQVTAAGTDHTSGSPIPQANIEPDSVVVSQQGHPPVVPGIGTWGAALMAAVFAGSLVWVVAQRRRRWTV
jgi:hypothetical protein